MQYKKLRQQNLTKNVKAFEWSHNIHYNDRTPERVA